MLFSLLAPSRRARLLALACLLLPGCGGADDRAASGQPPAAAAPRPAILLVTLDTTRADAIGPEAAGVETPAFDALSARGLRFRQAYTAVPETLPSHITMMTGLYPGGHGIHENARSLPAGTPVLAAQLQSAGYRTAAYVSSFALARRFGLARGFDVYDAGESGGSERAARATTDAALASLAGGSERPLFLWVHYWDPHYPYDPPSPFKERYAGSPYLGEVAAMDEQLGRLIEAFTADAGDRPVAVVVAGDHGEGLGDHGERLHGNLLYQSTMRVPLVVVGPGVTAGVRDEPVSIRRVHDTILGWAGGDGVRSLIHATDEVVLGEAMKPFLEYGWQPQTMVVDGRRKAIQAGRLEVYDVVADPKEQNDLGGGANLRAEARQALDDYPIPSTESARTPPAIDDEARQRLASLGYVSAGAAPVVRRDAPRPADMTAIFDLLDRASGLFVAGEYREAIPLFEQIVARDPYNLDAHLRLAVAHSSLGHEAQAEAAFAEAARLAPESMDVRLYVALHRARGRDWAQAAPLLEQVLQASPDRLAALEALAAIREKQRRPGDVVDLRQRIYALRTPTAPELLQLGALAMAAQRTPDAIAAFERARAIEGASFARNLELGVLYLAERRFEDARSALDRVPRSHPEYPMALFKRAQVSVLLNEPDRSARIDAARQAADATTRPLIEQERLFQGRGAGR